MKQEISDLFFAKLEDLHRLSQRRPCFLGFLDEAQSEEAEGFLFRRKASFLLWGGYEEAQRKVAGVFPNYLEPSPEHFPVAPLTFSYRGEDILTHRDFLGAFMALGLERTVVGDILLEPGRCVAFVKMEMADYLLQNIQKVGKVGVRGETGFVGGLPSGFGFLDISGVVASERLDCLVAFLCRVSREKAAAMVSGGLVAVNHRECLSGAFRLNEGDLLSVRGKGRFLIDRLGPHTGKGRLSVQCRKYK